MRWLLFHRIRECRTAGGDHLSLLPWSLVLLSGAIHALWNLKVKQVDDRSLFLAVAYISAGLFMLPLAVGSGGLFIPENAVLPVVLSAAAESLYVITLAKAYSMHDFSFVYPIARGSGPVWATAAGIIFLNEQMSAVGVLGIAAVISGILIVGFKRGKESFSGLFFPILTGFFIGTYSFLDRQAIEYTSVYNLLFWKFLMAGMVLFLIHLKQKSLLESVKKNLKLSVAAGLFILTAYFLVVLAMQYSNLGYVTAGRESGIAFSCLLGALILKEKIDGVRIAGTLVLFMGIALLKFA